MSLTLIFADLCALKTQHQNDPNIIGSKDSVYAIGASRPSFRPRFDAPVPDGHRGTRPAKQLRWHRGTTRVNGRLREKLPPVRTAGVGGPLFIE